MAIFSAKRTVVVWIAGAGLLLTALAQAWAAPDAGSTGLALRIAPETRVTPASVPLSLDVTQSGDVQAQPVTVEAWFRALPNQETRLSARITDLTGAAGIPAAATVAWDATSISGTGGGAAVIVRQQANRRVYLPLAHARQSIGESDFHAAGRQSVSRRGITGRVDFSLDAR